MENSKEAYYKKYDKILIYFVIYTIAFFALVKTLPYTLPFVIAFIIAAVITPLVKKIVDWTKNKINYNIIIIAVLLVFYGIIGTTITAFKLFGIDLLIYFTSFSEKLRILLLWIST